MSANELLNKSLDIELHPNMQMWGRSLSAFQFYVGIGLVFGIIVSIILARHLELSTFVMFGIVFFSLLIFYVQALIKKVITGVENLVLYRDLIAVIVGIGLVLKLLGQPVFVYLDVTVIGIAIFQLWARVGCLMAGCCYGRPHKWGIHYEKKSVTGDFPNYLVGVRLLPTQLFESLWVLCIVLPGLILFRSVATPGNAFSWYVLAYALGRYLIEFARGDVDRKYFWGFSEAQWTSLILVCAVAVAELMGILESYRWHLMVAAIVPSSMIAVSIKRLADKSRTYKLVNAPHIREIALALKQFDEKDYGQDMKVLRTSLDLVISTSRISGSKEVIDHHALSRHDKELSRDSARKLAKLICCFHPSATSSQLIHGNRGIIHLIFRDSPRHKLQSR